MIRRNAAVCIAAIGLSLCLTPAVASPIVYQNLPTSLPAPPVPGISFHNAVGPVIADDFKPIGSGQADTLTWWGSAVPGLTNPNNQWEIVLQNNNPALGEPALTPAGNNATGGVKEIVNAVGVAYAPIPGVFQYTASLLPLAFDLLAGTNYWLTVANTADGWSWALALLGPTVGSEDFNAHQSVGGQGLCTDGGPHCGPWTDIHTDFAFEITATPIPGALPLFASGLGALGLLGWRRKRKVAAAIAA